ncbi:beta strand repeat-containing protein [Pseudolactococcus reticulitermitis]|uniref:Mucin binding domain-containing protein n=2 Tax=Pseudolactococcus reticulitermitis TaxID=2025039 RepID=A0A224WZP2_9LACT|nr:hypothetical protein RsY01_1107 [Lactococcus reticulitermitis]
MKRGTLKIDEIDCKKRFVLRKVKKRWVVTGIVFATLVPGLSFAEREVVADDSIFSSNFPTLFGKSLTLPKTAQQVTGVVPFTVITTPTIDNVTDTTQVGESHTATYDNSNYQNNFTISSTGSDTGTNALAYNTTIGGTKYTVLTPTANGHNPKTGAVAFKQQIDMTKDWTFNFNIDLTRLSSGGLFNGYVVGDFIGLVLSPTAPNQLATAGGSKQFGGGLGLNGLPNSLNWGIDFYNNSSSQDGNYASYTPVGFGDSALGINPGAGYNMGNQVMGWRSTGSDGLLETASQTTDEQQAITTLNGQTTSSGNSNNQWGASGPQITAPVAVSYVYDGNNSGTITIEVTTSSSQTFTRVVDLTNTSMSLGVMAGYNQGYTQMGTHITNFTLELGTGTTTVNYLDQNNKPLRAATSFIANTTDTIGITGGSPNATSDTYDFTAPSFQGYSLVPNGTTAITVGSDTIDDSGTTVPGNTLNVNYQGDYQSAPLTAKSDTLNVPVPLTLPSSDVTYHGTSNEPIAFTSTDASLTVPGYTYTVTGPDDKSYATLAAAVAANPNFDATSNGYNVTDDATPQPFVVHYAANQVTINYGTVTTAGNVDTSKASDLKTSDELKPEQPTIGQTLTSSLVTAVTTGPDTETPGLQTKGVIPNGYHLTGNVYWSQDGDATTVAVPTNPLTATDVNSSDDATLLFEIAKDYQEADVTINYENNAQTSTTLTQTGLTGDSFSFDLLGLPAQGYHFISAKDPAGDALSLPLASISGNFDATNNLQATSDANRQIYTLTATADVQQLNVNYIFPAGHNLSSQLTSTDKMRLGTTGTTFSDLTVPVIDGYTAVITYPDGSTQTSNTITGIVADNTSNGSSQIDSVPQTATVNYVANGQSITVNYTNPDGTTPSSQITASSTGAPYVTDGSYDAIPITQIPGYSSYVSINGSTPQVMTTVPAGSFGSTPIVIEVTYTGWQAQVNYYSQQVDSSGSPIGALTALPGSFASQVSGAGFGFDILFGTTSDVQTSNLQTANVVPAGYHVSDFYWSDKPDGTTQNQTPPYHTDWTWDNMTNTASGLVPSYQAAIVYQYTKDSQQANIKVVDAPDGQGVSNGDNTLSGMNGAPYTGVTGGTQVVSVPQINGYLATVTDSAGKVVSLTNSQFTITYDATNNGAATSDSTPQDYTITYAPRTANVLVNYTYATGTNTNVSSSSSVDTAAYTAPTLPQSVTLNTQTDGTYSLSVPDVSGYTWTVTDSNGNRYTSSTLPSSFTSNGTNITYTVSYAASNATHVIHYDEATYDATGKYSFTANPVPGLPAQTVTGAIGSIQTFGVTTSNITVPSGWSLDPMGASLASLTNDNDLLNGGDTAKRLTFVPGTTDYIVYLARDIQSVQVNFVQDPKSTPTLYQDGRTAETYSVSTASFARPGYDYTITDPSGQVVTNIEGTYDNTSNKNASSPIYNTGDGDTAPQVYTVTYTPQTQEAILKTDSSDPANAGGETYQTATGPTASTIQFDQSDTDLVRFGYNYNVTVSYTNSNGDTVSASYPTLALALAANATYNNNTVVSGQADSNPQIFTVSYTPSSQTAILQTDATDPAGAQTVDTRDGLTAQAITFLKNDSDLARAGYTYQVKAPNGTSYATLAAALAADGTYDATPNGTSTTDSESQTFLVSYTANPLTVQIQYVYGEPKDKPVPPADFGNQQVPTQAIGMTNGTSYTTDVNATPSSTPITVPTIPGYTPNVTTVMPKFTVDSTGNPTEPLITVTYSASPDSATITYVDEAGKALTPYIGNNPTSQSGYTDGIIMTTSPSVSGYTLKGFKYNGGNLNTNLDDLNQALYTIGTDEIQFVYTPNEQVVNIHYLYSSDDKSPKDGAVPSEDFGMQTVTNSVTGLTNTTGTPLTVPTIPGYTASVNQVTPDFAIKADGSANGQLVTPDINVTYTANNQNATIAYKIASIDASSNSSILTDASSSQINGAPTTATGVTDQAIGVTPPAIPGYNIISQKSNGKPVSDISTATFSATSNPDQLEVIYAPNPQAVTVHYIFQLPTGYAGKYGQKVLADTDNGTEVPGLDAVPVEGYSNATSPNVMMAPPPTSVEPGWQVSPATQTIDWTPGTDGNLNKTDYYYYISPETSQVAIQYVATDGYDLMGLIHANNLNPILSSQALGGATFANSGAIGIPGYTYANYVYNNNTSTDQPNTAMPYVPDANNLTINYTPSAQTVAINYVYDANDGSPIDGAVTPTNTTGWNPSTAQLSQTKVSNAAGDSITVPTIPGYTANVSTVTPNFAINADGSLVTPTITVTYTANQNNIATMTYVDTAGNDISQYASTPVALNASGTTDQSIPTSGEVSIPGYTFDHIEFTPVNGSPQSNTTVDKLIFSGGSTTSDQVKFVYQANNQEVTVHYLYSGGGLNGQEIVGLTPGKIIGTSNQALTTTPAPDAPVGYDLVKAGLTSASGGTFTQPVMWTTVNGQLVTPDIYFYYQAKTTQATVNYTTTVGGNDLNVAVPTGTVTSTVNGQTDATIPVSGAVSIPGYTFDGMWVNSVQKATTVADANAITSVFTPNATENGQTTIEYRYTPDTQKAVVKFVDASGNPIVDSSGQAIPDVPLTGTTGGAINYSGLTDNYSGYSLTTDGRTATPTYDSNDAVEQVVYMIYTPLAETAQVVYQDSNGNSLKTSTDLTGTSNGVIDYATIDTNISGYTLIEDGRTTTQRYDTDPNKDQQIVLKYQANPQQVIVDFKISRDGGKTWTNLANPTTLSGVSDATIDYSKLQQDYPGYKLIDASQQTGTSKFDTADGVNQHVNLYYAPLKQVAILQTDATDPDATGGQAITTTTDGYSFGSLSFAANSEQNLARKGFTYKIYGPDGVWYDSLANALAANATYDGTPTNTDTIDTIVPPATQSLKLGGRSGLVRSVTPNNPGIDPANPGLIAGDNVPQVFTASYTPMPESMVVQTINDPAGNKVYPTATGVTGLDDSGTPIASTSPLYQASMQLSLVPKVSDFYNVNVVDTQLQTTASGLPNLSRNGYTYVVKAPNGTEYQTLEAATKNVHVFDNDPSSNQVFNVIYTAQLQTANLISDSSDPKGAQTIETAHGPSDANISLNANDSNLKRSGYTYQVTGPDGKLYDTLADALKNNPSYDANAIPTDTGLDPTPQNFTVTYKPVKQTANLIVDGKTLDTVTGDSDSKLTFNQTDNDLYRSGYTYQVTASNGKVYQSLAEALKAVSTFDHNDLTDGTDATPQNFIVVYTKNKDTETPPTPSTPPHGQDQQAPNQEGGGQDFGTFGERITQYGLLGAILIAIPILIFLGLKKRKKKSEK